MPHRAIFWQFVMYIYADHQLIKLNNLFFCKKRVYWVCYFADWSLWVFQMYLIVVLSVAPWAYQPSQSCDSQGYWKSMFLEFRCSFRLNLIVHCVCLVYIWCFELVSISMYLCVLCLKRSSKTSLYNLSPLVIYHLGPCQFNDPIHYLVISTF